MASLSCPDCGVKVQPEDLICFRCGANLPHIPGPDDDVLTPTISQRFIAAGSDAAAFARFDNVSRRHATVQVDDGGHATIRDEGSTNGTYVNDDRVLPGTDVRLVDGDRVRLAADVTGSVSLPQAEPDPSGL